MAFRESPLDPVAVPPHYPAPDWEAIGRVARVWVPDDETVGYLVLQADTALAFLTNSNPEQLGYVIRDLVLDILQASAARGDPAPKAWDAILRSTLHTTPTDTYLPALTADLRKEWAT